jgi:hypothetical protein
MKKVRILSNFFMRKIEVYVDTKKFTFPELDITFKTKFDTEPIPNEAECSIFNLSDYSKAFIRKGMGIVINAGYGNDIGTVLDGVITKVDTERNGLDKETKIKCLNVPNQFLQKPIAYTYAPGVSNRHVMLDVLDHAGGIKPNILQISHKFDYARGFAAYGKTIDVLRRLVHEARSRLIIHNSSINIISADKGIETGFLLNSKTGLIDVEVIDKPDNISTHKIKMLLNHAIAPYSLLKVESNKLNGVVMVISGTHDSSFTTDVEVRTL